MFGLHRKSWPIALDIGSESIRMLQLHKAGHMVTARACAQWKFPDKAAGDPVEHRAAAIVSVREILRKGGFQGRSVVTCLSGSQLQFKSIRLPHMPAGELAEAIRWEAGERFGFAIERDCLRHLVAGQVRQGNEVQDEVIMMAVPAAVVDDHLAMLDDMGLRPVGIDAEPVAVFRTLERFLRRQADESAVSVVVDIGAAASRVIVARGRQIVFLKTIDIGGRKLTEAVASQLNISYAEAAELRMVLSRGEPDSAQAPMRGNWTIHDAIRSEVEALAREIGLCLRYCSVTFRGLRPEQVVVTGGLSHDRTLMELLSENLNLKCIQGQPLRGIDVSGTMIRGDRRGTLAEWALCAGLAMRDQEDDVDLEEAENGQNRLSA